MKHVVYTCLFGDYDVLPNAPVAETSADAVCFTDRLDRDNKGWQLRPLPSGCPGDSVRLSRFAKILPHRVLPEYDSSIYLDCNVRFGVADTLM